jgi:hypothetical protein
MIHTVTRRCLCAFSSPLHFAATRGMPSHLIGNDFMSSYKLAMKQRFNSTDADVAATSMGSMGYDQRQLLNMPATNIRSAKMKLNRCP